MRFFNGVALLVINLLFNNHSFASDFNENADNLYRKLLKSEKTRINKNLKKTSLEKLYFKSVNIDSNDKEMLEAIGKNPSLVGLKKLYLVSSYFDSSFGTKLIKAIEKNTSLTKLSLMDNTIGYYRAIVEGRGGITTEDFFPADNEIPTILANKQLLKSLSLSNEFKNEKKFQQFALCLGSLNSLTSLHLSSCAFTNDRLLFLLGAIGKNKTLNNLSLDGSGLNDKSGRALISFIGSHPGNCLKLTIRNCQMSESIVATLKEIHDIDEALAYFEPLFEIVLVLLKIDLPFEVANIILYRCFALVFGSLGQEKDFSLCNQFVEYFNLQQERQQLIQTTQKPNTPSPFLGCLGFASH